MAGEQAEVLESCFREFDLDRVFVEGWTVEDVGLLRLIAESLWPRDPAPAAETDAPLRFRRLKFGPAARLWAMGRIPGIEAAESQALLDAANPFDAEGNYRGLTVVATEAREDFMVQQLLERASTAVIVLGGAHDLGDNIRRLAGSTCEYVRVRARGYDEICRRHGLQLRGTSGGSETPRPRRHRGTVIRSGGWPRVTDHQSLERGGYEPV